MKMKKAVKDHYSPKQVAAALDVSESSVKRWCDRGAIQVLKTVGGHRRVTKQALNDFLEKSNRSLVRPEVLEDGDVNSEVGGSTRDSIVNATSSLSAKEFSDSRWNPDEMNLQKGNPEVVDRFVAALADDDEETCRKIFTDLRNQGNSVAQLADQLICPALRKLGEEWSCFRIDIYQERRSCEMLISLIRDLVARLDSVANNRMVALGAAPSKDPYTLPGHIIEAMMKEMGWRAKNLGVDIPFESLLRAAHREKPNLFWLSISTIAEESSLVDSLGKFHASLPSCTRLVVGGRALTPAVRAKLTHISFCDSLEQLRGYAIAIESVLKSTGRN